jgi:hypothetical protein
VGSRHVVRDGLYRKRLGRLVLGHREREIFDIKSEGSGIMHGPQINRVSGKVIIVLSLIALLTVFSGYFQPPQPDEGAAAHIFQLSIAALVPTILLFFATADWRKPLQSARMLAFPAVALALTFAALYYLEHIYYLAHYR